MNNLTKHEVLKHRYLSLLKKLEDAGITAKCDANGEWRVGIASGCDVCMGTGKVRNGIETDLCPARGCPFRPAIEDCNARFVFTTNFGGFPVVMYTDDGYTTFTAPMSPLLSNLLDALKAAIVSAPAKA